MKNHFLVADRSGEHGGISNEAYRKTERKRRKAKSKEQAREIIAKAGMELTDEEMDMVSGGCDAIERLKSIDDDSKIRCKQTTELNKKTAENMNLLNNAQRH